MLLPILTPLLSQSRGRSWVLVEVPACSVADHTANVERLTETEWESCPNRSMMSFTLAVEVYGLLAGPCGVCMLCLGLCGHPPGTLQPSPTVQQLHVRLIDDLNCL